jgi:hypothetical protein
LEFEHITEEDLRNNPDTALKIIEEFLEYKMKQNPSNGMFHEVKEGDGDLYTVTLQSVRTDTHLVRAESPEEAVLKAAKRSDEEEGNTGKFHRRFENLDPMCLKVPTIEEIENTGDGEAHTYMEKRKPSNSAINKAIRKIKGDTPARKPSKEESSTIESISKYLKEKADEYDDE